MYGIIGRLFDDPNPYSRQSPRKRSHSHSEMPQNDGEWCSRQRLVLFRTPTASLFCFFYHYTIWILFSFSRSLARGGARDQSELEPCSGMRQSIYNPLTGWSTDPRSAVTHRGSASSGQIMRTIAQVANRSTHIAGCGIAAEQCDVLYIGFIYIL